jgi:hypothetical protein
VEDIIAIIFVFGGLTTVAISFSPLGKAFADRIRLGKSAPEPEVDHMIYDEVDRLRVELDEFRERLEFSERLLASSRESAESKGEGGA